jgi:hypothetical protein
LITIAHFPNLAVLFFASGSTICKRIVWRKDSPANISGSELKRKIRLVTMRLGTWSATVGININDKEPQL